MTLSPDMTYSDILFKASMFTTPEELFSYMSRKLAYKDVGYTSPVEIREKYIAQCWGASDYQFDELTAMGFDTHILFMSVGTPPERTHATTIFKRDGNYFWFEWAWSKCEGVNGKYHSIAHAREIIIKSFTEEYGKPDVVKIHHSKIGKKGMTDDEYLKKASC